MDSVRAQFIVLTLRIGLQPPAKPSSQPVNQAVSQTVSQPASEKAVTDKDIQPGNQLAEAVASCRLPVAVRRALVLFIQFNSLFQPRYL